MFARRISFFLTLVLLAVAAVVPAAHGAKKQPSPDFDEKPAAGPRAGVDDKTRELIDISPPPPATKVYREQEYFYPYRRALTLRIGQVNSSAERNGTKSPLLAGVQFLYTTLDRDHYEGAADLLSDGSGALQFGERFIFSHGTFRPYASAGARILVNPVDGMALIVNFANFQLAGSAGLEYLAYRTQSLRLQFDLAVGTKMLQVISSLGYVWAW